MVLVAVFLTFSLGNLTFKHQHILSDGTVIEHAHPHSEKNGENHNHNKDEICIKGIVTTGILLTQAYNHTEIESHELFISTPLLIEESVQLMNLPHNILRGPPTC